jgi:hypothetical protein
MDSIFDQKFMVTSQHRQRMAQPSAWPQHQQQQQQQRQATQAHAPLQQQTQQQQPQQYGGGIQPWHFEQYQDEAVFIPAGCPHQVSG